MRLMTIVMGMLLAATGAGAQHLFAPPLEDPQPETASARNLAAAAHVLRHCGTWHDDQPRYASCARQRASLARILSCRVVYDDFYRDALDLRQCLDHAITLAEREPRQMRAR